MVWLFRRTCLGFGVSVVCAVSLGRVDSFVSVMVCSYDSFDAVENVNEAMGAVSFESSEKVFD